MAYPRAFKFLLLGSLAVGKSSIARRLAFDTFDSDYKSTIGVQLHKLTVDVAGVHVSVEMWDTDGDLAADTLSSVYARGASGALIVCDTQRPGPSTRCWNYARQWINTCPDGLAFACSTRWIW